MTPSPTLVIFLNERMFIFAESRISVGLNDMSDHTGLIKY
jgi:hypothetical protein